MLRSVIRYYQFQGQRAQCNVPSRFQWHVGTTEVILTFRLHFVLLCTKMSVMCLVPLCSDYVGMYLC